MGGLEVSQVVAKAANGAVVRVRFRELARGRREQGHEVRDAALRRLQLERVDRVDRDRGFADRDAVSDPGRALAAGSQLADDRLAFEGCSADHARELDDLCLGHRGAVVDGGDRGAVLQRIEADPTAMESGHLTEGRELRQPARAGDKRAVARQPPAPRFEFGRRHLADQHCLTA